MFNLLLNTVSKTWKLCVHCLPECPLPMKVRMKGVGEKRNGEKGTTQISVCYIFISSVSPCAKICCKGEPGIIRVFGQPYRKPKPQTDSIVTGLRSKLATWEMTKTKFAKNDSNKLYQVQKAVAMNNL